MKNSCIALACIYLGCLSCTSTHFDFPSTIAKKNVSLSSTLEPENSFYGVPDSISVVNISVGKLKTDINGILYFNPESAKISLWRDFHQSLTVRNVKEALQGIAYDVLESRSISCENSTFSSSISHQNLPPGKYMICVVLNDSVENGKNAFSIKKINVEKSGKIAVKKAFTTESKNQTLENWEN